MKISNRTQTLLVVTALAGWMLACKGKSGAKQTAAPAAEPAAELAVEPVAEAASSQSWAAGVDGTQKEQTGVAMRRLLTGELAPAQFQQECTASVATDAERGQCETIASAAEACWAQHREQIERVKCLDSKVSSPSPQSSSGGWVQHAQPAQQ